MSDALTPISFGFLPYNWTIKFDYGEIIPVPNFDKQAQFIEKHLHKDGYFYPPTVKTIIVNRLRPRTIPKTKRPAHLYQLPVSHTLDIPSVKNELNIREGAAGFMIHLLAFLFQTRLQFADWAFDGRIPIRKQPSVGPFEAGRCLSQAYKVWSIDNCII